MKNKEKTWSPRRWARGSAAQPRCAQLVDVLWSLPSCSTAHETAVAPLLSPSLSCWRTRLPAQMSRHWRCD